MTTRRTDLNETPLIIAEGDIDRATCGAVDDLLDKAISEGSDIVLLDLGAVSYIDSGGLSVLFAAGRRVRETGWLGLVAPNASVRRLLELVGAVADPAFRIFDDLGQAETALTESVTT